MTQPQQQYLSVDRKEDFDYAVDFDYVVDMDTNITMNKEQERDLKFVDRKLKLDVVDRVLLFPVSHTMDSELNIVVDELGEAAVVRARHNPPP
ncbi:hypothetical protein F2Q70_00030587 [Brassica cretica]|uniref:Uncharacterized protein n=1 Tax=Brassica cretica TaxID=69181 RepID=A0A8S9FDQ6_BRACR|nr:hypothetical protein F2Q70_00030587 [Brassica cretica]